MWFDLCVSHSLELALTHGDPMNEWCPQCFVFNSQLSSCRCMPKDFVEGVNLSHSWSFYFSALFYFSQHHCLFQSILTSHLMMCLKQDSFSFVIFAPRDVPGLICSRTRSSTFCWFQICVKLFSNTFGEWFVLQRNHFFFLPAFFLIQLSQPCVVIRDTGSGWS